MNKRIAKKVLNENGPHYDWYYRNGLISLAPVHPELYFRACRRMHQKPYYDAKWLSDIQKWRREHPVNIKR